MACSDGDAAIDYDGLARHERAGRRGQEDGRACNLVRLTDAAKRCVAVRLISNSPETNDLPEITLVGRGYYRDLLAVNETPEVSGCAREDAGLRIWEWVGQSADEATRSQGTMHSKFDVVDGEVLYALGAIRNVGLEAMRSLVETREQGGAFVDIFDFLERIDPRGLPYYWVGGQPPTGVAAPGTDFSAVEDGRISVTPIHLDLTARGLLRRLRDWDLELP
jgi:hypothetical protein